MILSIRPFLLIQVGAHASWPGSEENMVILRATIGVLLTSDRNYCRESKRPWRQQAAESEAHRERGTPAETRYHTSHSQCPLMGGVKNELNDRDGRNVDLPL